MMKRLVVLLACMGLAAPMTGCSLFKSSQPESEVAADMDSADLEGLEGEESLDLDGESLDVAADESLASDQLPEEALGETEMDLSDAPLELEDTEQPDIAAEMDTLPADPFGESGAQDVPPPAEDPLMAETEAPAEMAPPAETDASSFGMADTPSNDSNSSDTSYETSDSSTTIVDGGDEPVKKNIPLQKVPTTPWKVGRAWFNTVYFAKPGDTLLQISRTIYGDDRTEELKRGNPTFNSRDVKPGDKIYYNSPNRPDDSSRLITYYEDNGMTPEVYIAREGDNIRTVSKDLLGYDNAWKEVWASNSVESKGEISAGTELRYWKGRAVAAAPSQAQPEMAPPAPAEQMPPQDFAQGDAYQNQMPPQQADAEVPPPPMPEDQPPMDMGAMPPQDPAMDMAAQEQLPPPPPPMEEAINPPPPPPQMVAEEDQGAPATDEDTTLALAVVGLAAAGLAILIVMRKKRRQRELEQQAMDNTHVGT